MDEIDGHFIVKGEERFTINDEEYILTNAEHFIINGEEYVMIDGVLYLINGDEDHALSEIEDHFIVEGEKRYVIHGDEYILTNAEHFIINGEEYIQIDDELYCIDNSGHNAFSGDDSQSRFTIGNIIGSAIGIAFVALIVVIVGGVGVAFVGGFIEGINPQDVATPQTIAPTVVQPKSYTSYDDKLGSEIKNAMDYTNPVTRNFALSLIDSSHSGSGNFGQICDMWDYIHDDWTYVSDPSGSEYFAKASETIEAGLKGDCDDFALLVGSVIQATGGHSRIIAARSSDGKDGHAYPEILLGNEESLQNVVDYISYRYNCAVVYYCAQDVNGKIVYWLNLDWQSKHPGGKYFRDSGVVKAYYPNGYWEEINVA